MCVGVCACVHMCACVHVFVCEQLHVCAFIYYPCKTCRHAYKNTIVYCNLLMAHVFAYMYVRMYSILYIVYTHTCMCVCLFMWSLHVCTNACIYVCTQVCTSETCAPTRMTGQTHAMCAAMHEIINLPPSILNTYPRAHDTISPTSCMCTCNACSR